MPDEPRIPTPNDQPTGNEGTTAFPLWALTPRLPGRLGKFELRRPIGAGGMGVVYEAVQESPRRVVALKVLRIGAESPAMAARFEREADLLARLQHPNIAQIFDAGHHHGGAPGGMNDIAFFAMEFVEQALPITEYAEREKLSLAARVSLMAKVCDAVQHAHERGVVHRDLKPTNILVGADGVPKVIDFGIARMMEAVPPPDAPMTEPGTLVGTLQYMAPEQCGLAAGDRTRPPADARSDVYSLGVTAYQLLTGQLPYDLTGMSTAAAARAIRENEPTPVSRVAPGLPADAGAVIGKCLSKSPRDRYASARELAEELRRLAEARAVHAPSPTAWRRAASRVESLAARKPALLTAVVALAAFSLVSVLGVPVFFVWTKASRAFDSAMASLGAAPALAGFEYVRVVLLTDDDDVDALARGCGIQLPPADAPGPLRELHGAAFERLAACKPRAVGYDMHMPTAVPERDGAMLRGVLALKDAGADTVIATEGWPDAEGVPAIPVSLLPAARWGPASADVSVGGVRSIDVAMEREPADPIPGFALAVACATMEPGANPTLRFDAGSSTVTARFSRPLALAPGVNVWRREQLVVPVTAIEMEPGDSREFNLRKGDRMARLAVTMPDAEQRQRATIPYSRLFAVDTTEVQETLKGRTVLIANFREGVDSTEVPGQGLVPNVYSVAAGVEDMLRGGRRSLDDWEYAGLIAAGAVLGAFAGYRLRGPLLGAISLIVGAAAIVVSAVLLYRQGAVLMYPFEPVTALVLAGAVSMWISHLRRRRLG